MEAVTDEAGIDGDIFALVYYSSDVTYIWEAKAL